MSEPHSIKESKQPAMMALVLVISIIFLVGFGLSLFVLVQTSSQEQLFTQKLCFTKVCVDYYFTKVDTAFLIAKSTLEICVSVATVGGIFVALLSYFNTSGNAALTNHIEHLKVFSEYLESEVKKRDRLSSNLIDTLLLYGVIFNQSRSGKTSVSVEYLEFIVDLNKIISESNRRCASNTARGFSYVAHQKAVRDHLAKAGITVYLAPRNDYFEMESQLFSLLHRVSQSFCAPGILPHIEKIDYH